jgi:hypothetical protein
MAKGLVRRLLSAVLLALVAAGGGRLSTVDALVFHEGSAEADGFRSHFEASSGCHQDGCSMRSTAHESRPGPSLAAPAIHAALPETVGAAPPVPDVLPRLASSSHLSRAPPFSA